MPNVVGSKWGDSTLGTPGGIVTWSIVGAGEDISRFGISTQTSVSGNSFLDYNFTDVIAGAFAQWSKYGDIEFQQVSDGGGAAGVGNDADIRIFFGAIPGATAGYAFYPSLWGSAIAGDVLLDTLDRFNTDPDLFEAVVLHELGHSLGLGHVSGESIMTSTVRKIGLQSDDIAGIQQIYGVQQDAPAPPPGDDNNDHSDDHDHDHDHDHNPDPLPPTPPTPQPDGEDQQLVGTDSNDVIKGRNGEDTLLGGDGYDRLFGGNDDDRLEGGADRDKLFGGKGADDLFGDSGNDLLKGGHSRDYLDGGSEDDFLFGQWGEDTLEGGAGNDRLQGGRHSDIFVFADNHGHDRIVDFNARNPNEKIDLSALTGFDSFQDVLDAAYQKNRHTVIDTGADDSIHLTRVNLSHLDASDFIF